MDQSILKNRLFNFEKGSTGNAAFIQRPECSHAAQAGNSSNNKLEGQGPKARYLHTPEQQEGNSLELSWEFSCLS